MPTPRRRRRDWSGPRFSQRRLGTTRSWASFCCRTRTCAPRRIRMGCSLSSYGAPTEWRRTWRGGTARRWSASEISSGSRSTPPWAAYDRRRLGHWFLQGGGESGQYLDPLGNRDVAYRRAFERRIDLPLAQTGERGGAQRRLQPMPCRRIFRSLIHEPIGKAAEHGVERPRLLMETHIRVETAACLVALMHHAIQQIGGNDRVAARGDQRRGALRI